jgi:hypothetical protein
MMRVRPWCAVAQYPDKAPFLFGTVAMPDGSRHDQVIEAILEAAGKVLPEGLDILEIKCGSLFFQEEQ